MANVRINEIDAVLFENLSFKDSMIILDHETRETRRISLEQLGRVLTESAVSITRVITSEDRTLRTTERAIFVKNDLSSNVTITLPDATLADSREYHIAKADDIVGTVLLAASGSQELNGQHTFELNGPHQSVTLLSNGTGWYVF